MSHHVVISWVAGAEAASNSITTFTASLIFDLLDVYRGHAAESLILNPQDRTHPNAFDTLLAARATRDVLIEKQFVLIGRAVVPSK